MCWMVLHGDTMGVSQGQACIKHLGDFGESRKEKPHFKRKNQTQGGALILQMN